jgi:hypothetical protein
MELSSKACGGNRRNLFHFIFSSSNFLTALPVMENDIFVNIFGPMCLTTGFPKLIKFPSVLSDPKLKNAANITHALE